MDGFFPKPRQDGPGRGDTETAGTDKGNDGQRGTRDQEGDIGGHKGGNEEEIEQWLRDITNRELTYFLAGVIGVHPGPFTLRKLLWMSNGKERSDWNKFSVLVAKIHNVNCTKDSELIDFKDVHPDYITETIAKKKHGLSDDEVRHNMMILERELSRGN